MIKRVIWLSVGVALTVFVISKAPKTLGTLAGSRSLTGGLLDGVTGFISDVRENMAEREEELNAALQEV